MPENQVKLGPKKMLDSSDITDCIAHCEATGNWSGCITAVLVHRVDINSSSRDLLTVWLSSK